MPRVRVVFSHTAAAAELLFPLDSNSPTESNSGPIPALHLCRRLPRRVTSTVGHSACAELRKNPAKHLPELSPTAAACNVDTRKAFDCTSLSACLRVLRIELALITNSTGYVQYVHSIGWILLPPAPPTLEPDSWQGCTPNRARIGSRTFAVMSIAFKTVLRIS